MEYCWRDAACTHKHTGCAVLWLYSSLRYYCTAMNPITKGSNSASFMSAKHLPEEKLIKSSMREKSNWLLQKQRSQVHWRDEMSHEWSRRKEKGRMDRRVFCSKRCVCTREERWVIRDFEDCYRGRRFIPAPRSYRKEELRLVNGRVRTGKWVWEGGRWSAGMYCGIVHEVLYYNKLSVRQWDQKQLLFSRGREFVCWSSMKLPLTSHDIINNWGGSQGEIQDSDSFLKTVLQIQSGFNVQAALGCHILLA